MEWVVQCTLYSVQCTSVPQGIYRGRVEIGGVYICPLSWSVHHKSVVVDKHSERGWMFTPHGTATKRSIT